MAPRKTKVANSLVTLSSAAIVAVYAAGFMKTRAAAEKIEDASNERRPSMPAPSTAGETRPPAPIEPPAAAPAAAAQVTTVKSPVMPKPDPPVHVTSPAHDATSATVLAEKPVPASTDTAAPAAAPEHIAVSIAPSVALESASTDPVATASKSDEKPAGARLYPKEHYTDGTYLGWGTSRHGDIQASVTIKDGRIAVTSIAQCLTRYSCSWIAHLPGQIVARQSQDCDYVSGATQSANAFYWAVVDALNKAK